MTTYFAFLAILFLLAHTGPSSRAHTWIMGLVIFLISGLRYDVGFDYVAYYDWCRNGLDPYLALSMEPVPRALIDGVTQTGMPQLFFIVTSALIIVPFVAAFSLRSAMPALSLFAFFCMPLMFLVSMAIIRQYLAISIIFFAITVYGRRFLPCMALLVLAVFFHYSALIVCFIYPVARRFADRSFSIPVIASVLLAAPILSSLLMKVVAPLLPFYASYVGTEGDSGGKMIILYYLLAGIVLLLRRKLQTHVETEYINWFLLGVFIFGAAAPVNEVVGRIAYYFLPFFALLVPGFAKVIKPAELSRLLILIVLSLLLFVQLHIASGNPEKDPYQPYQINTELF